MGLMRPWRIVESPFGGKRSTVTSATAPSKFVFCFVFSWNEFAVALNLTMKQTATVPVAIAKFAQDFEIQYTQMAASAALSILPALILLLIGQRYIVKGLTTGAVK